MLSCEPTVSPLNDNEIDFRISFDESDDEDYTVIYDDNSFSCKIISVNNLKTDSENDNDKVNIPSFLSPEPKVSYSNDLDFFKDFENEFQAIAYNDTLMSKSDFVTIHTRDRNCSLSLMFYADLAEKYDMLIVTGNGHESPAHSDQKMEVVANDELDVGSVQVLLSAVMKVKQGRRYDDTREHDMIGDAYNFFSF
ncbi:hypothetical protein Tco_0926902 [Tanacetum coccineum]|uniref:Uncharacterized protein n=1 Tax=Tanacetum coccineum TaxID=301880 RepID=A0ABQ5DD29_9ASTR